VEVDQPPQAKVAGGAALAGASMLTQLVERVQPERRHRPDHFLRGDAQTVARAIAAAVRRAGPFQVQSPLIALTFDTEIQSQQLQWYAIGCSCQGGIGRISARGWWARQVFRVGRFLLLSSVATRKLRGYGVRGERGIRRRRGGCFADSAGTRILWADASRR